MYGGMCFGPYVQSIMNLQTVLQGHGWPTMISFMFNESLITRARNSLTHNFLKTDCTHLMFIDSDIRFEAQQVPPMVAADVPILCGIYPKKEISWGMVRRGMEAGVPDDQLKYWTGSFVVNLVGYVGETTVPTDKPCEIWQGGTGFMLIKREVFEALAPHTPSYKSDVVDLSGQIGQGEEIKEYFATSIEPGTKRLLSEDYHFCYQYRTKCDGKVYAAPWVQLAHCGTYFFEGRMIQNADDNRNSSNV